LPKFSRRRFRLDSDAAINPMTSAWPALRHVLSSFARNRGVMTATHPSYFYAHECPVIKVNPD